MLVCSTDPYDPGLGPAVSNIGILLARGIARRSESIVTTTSTLLFDRSHRLSWDLTASATRGHVWGMSQNYYIRITIEIPVRYVNTQLVHYVDFGLPHNCYEDYIHRSMSCSSKPGGDRAA